MEPVDPTPVGEPLLVTATDLADDGLPDDVDVPVDGPPADAAAAQRSHGGTRRRWLLAGLAGTAAAVAIGGFVLREDVPPPKPDIPLDAWVPYWTLDASTEVAAQRIPSMRDVSPFWFNATGADEVSIDPNADIESTDAFLDVARSSGATIVPSIVDALPAGGMAAILADAESRQTHIDTLLDFASDGDYAGIDLDYEQFAFADGRDTWEATRPNWVAFIEQLASGLHADNRTLTVSIPPVYDAGRTADSGFWVYDHGAIAEHVDAIRIMAYDFSVGDAGPIAPLEFVERAIDGALEATDSPDKIVLGLPAYGRNWVVASSPECDGVDVEGTTSVNNRTVDELIQRRGATPVFSEETAEWSFTYDLTVDGTSCVQSRQVHYVDADGIGLRMDLARANQLAGVSLWAFGFEDDEVWEAILPTVTAAS